MKKVIKTIMAKYLLAVLLTGAICVLVACGGEKESETETQLQPDLQETETESEYETDVEEDETELTLPRDEF